MSSPENLGDAERLEWLLERLGLTQAELAGQTGRSPQYVNDILRARKRIARDFALVLAQRYDVRVAWLLTGEGGPWAETTYTTTPAPEVHLTCADSEVIWRCRTCRGILSPQDIRCPGCDREVSWPGEDTWEPPEPGKPQAEPKGPARTGPGGGLSAEGTK
jgi:hypothetical protein